MNRLGINYNRQGSKVTLLTAFANIAAASTDAAFIPAEAGKRITILSILAHAAGSVETNVTLNSKGPDAGTAITSTKQISGNGGWSQSRACDTDYLFQTKPGQALTVTTGAGSTVGIDVLYCYLED